MQLHTFLPFESNSKQTMTNCMQFNSTSFLLGFSDVHGTYIPLPDISGKETYA